jgi:chemotaxis signal transduction protein
VSAVSPPASPPRFRAAPAPASPEGRARPVEASDVPVAVPRAEPEPTASAAPAPPQDARPAGTDADGYVLFAVGSTTFAVAVGEVREVIRAARLELLPGTAPYGRGLALVDVRGRSIPVVDLRESQDAPGDVLLPVYRHHVGLVVDRVLAVRTPRDLGPEHDDVPGALPSYARGVLRPVDGGAPVLLIAMPDAAEIEADAARVDEPRLGHDVLGSPEPG